MIRDGVEIFSIPEPDLVGHDGLYGSYLTQYPTSGRYRLTVHVETVNTSLTLSPSNVLRIFTMPIRQPHSMTREIAKSTSPI